MDTSSQKLSLAQYMTEVLHKWVRDDSKNPTDKVLEDTSNPWKVLLKKFVLLSAA